MDWIEATMVLEEQPWSRAAIIDAFPSGAKPDQADMDLALAEIERRRSAAPTIYPLGIDDDNGTLDRANGVDPRIYDFLVLLSFPRGPYRAKHQFNIINPMFDLLVREALRNYLGGPGAQAVRFGWPTRDGRPESLLEATPWLAHLMGLPVLSLAKLDADDKDAGVDVVAWRPFAGGGGGFSHVLMQNTVEVDFRRKPGDVVPTKWLKMIDFGPLPPIGLAVPFAVDPGSKIFDEINNQAHVILDRLRLSEHLDGRDLAGVPEWDEIEQWNQSQRAELLQSLAQAAVATSGRKRRPPRATSTPPSVARRRRATRAPRQQRHRG